MRGANTFTEGLFTLNKLDDFVSAITLDEFIALCLRGRCRSVLAMKDVQWPVPTRNDE